MSGAKTHLRRFSILAGCVVSILLLTVCPMHGPARGESEIAAPVERRPITINADVSHEWKEGQTSIAVLRGHCKIVQGDMVVHAHKLVLWQRTDRSGRITRHRLSAYLEDDVRLERAGQTVNETSLFLNLVTREEIGVQIRRRLTSEPPVEEALYQRAKKRRRESRRRTLLQTQLIVEGGPEDGPELRSAPLVTQGEAPRRVRIFPRSSIPYNIHSHESTDTLPAEQVWVLTGGIRILIDETEDFGTVDLAADRMVIWTESQGANGFRPDRGTTLQSRDTPFTVYLEGHIIIRQDQTVVRAERATYDARENRALYDDVEIRTFNPKINGDLRIRAKRVRQFSRDNFHAHDAWATASTFGKPGYRWRSSDIFLEKRYTNPWYRLGSLSGVDPMTGMTYAEELEEGVDWMTSWNNTFLVEEVPIFYLPYLSGPAENPDIPLRSASVTSDSIFGVQFKTVWDASQLFGIKEPDNTHWNLLLDEYTKRGPLIGTSGSYAGTGLFGLAGRYRGEGALVYINDNGVDNLGLGRRTLELETSNRYRAQLRHRHDLPNQVTVLGEIGILSDRNFLEQYDEHEWDHGKDVETLIYIKQDADNWAWTAMGRPRANDFTTTTEWLPRGDLYGLSEPLLGGLVTWSSHTSAGYARLRPGDPPTDPAETFTPIPFVANVDGAVLMSRHEVDIPFGVGPVRVVPYLMGEGAFWSEDFTGNQIDRIVGSAGVRSSVTIWRAFPWIRSRIFNLNGLAHKMVLESDYSMTDSSESFANIPQYNEIDDNAQERFRQRFLTNTYLGMLPGIFEPRFYAIRYGAGRGVTAPYHELIDDQQVFRLALRQRLQTKVGPPDNLRIKDWMTFDLETSVFPNSSQDNFGETFGIIGGRYRWNIGDRTSLLANATVDLFDGGQELFDIGIVSQRTKRGSISVGLRQVKGLGIDSRVAFAAVSYQLSPKWVSSVSTAYDIGEDRNTGQLFALTRIGGDFLFHFGATFDESKNNAGISFSVEPRLYRLSKPNRHGSLLTNLGP